MTRTYPDVLNIRTPPNGVRHQLTIDVFLESVPPDEPPLYLARAVTGSFGLPARTLRDDPDSWYAIGHAADRSKATAQRRAYFEAVERTARSLYANHCAPEYSVLPESSWASIAGIPFNPDISASRPTVACRSFRDDDLIRVPAELAGVSAPGYEGRLVREQLTTGDALAETVDASLAHGAAEVVERHHFMGFFHGAFAAHRLDNSASRDATMQLLALYRLRPYFLVIGSTDVPWSTVLCVLIDTTRFGPAVTSGLATGPSLTSSVLKSLYEAWQPRIWLREHAADESLPAAAPASALERGIYWSHAERREAVVRALEDLPVAHRTCFKPFPSSLDAIDTGLRNGGHRPYWLELAQLQSPRAVATRTIVPSMYPLYLNESFRYPSTVATRTGLGAEPHFFL